MRYCTMDAYFKGQEVVNPTISFLFPLQHSETVSHYQLMRKLGWFRCIKELLCPFNVINWWIQICIVGLFNVRNVTFGEDKIHKANEEGGNLVKNVKIWEHLIKQCNIVLYFLLRMLFTYIVEDCMMYSQAIRHFNARVPSYRLHYTVCI